MILFEIKQNNKIKKIYVDLDGVLADFHARAEEIWGAPVPTDSLLTNNDAFWKKMQTVPRLYRDLPWMSDGQKLWKYVSGYEPTILTAIPRTSSVPHAADDKRHWVTTRLGRDVPVIISPNTKSKQMHAEPGTVLIDDRPDTIERWNAAGGMGIHHKNTKTTIQQLQKLGI